MEVSVARAFRFSAAFPAFPVILSCTLYYVLGHSRPGRIRTISEMVMDYPERAIFSSTLSITALLLLLCFFAREQWICQICKPGRRYSAITRIFIPVMAISAVVVGEVTLRESKPIHLGCATLLFVGLIAYFIASDRVIARAGFAIGTFSYFLPFLTLIFFVVYTVILVFFLRNRTIYSIGSICEYITALGLFGKVWLAGEDMPAEMRLTIGIARGQSSQKDK
jgi:hypothetical protein